MAAPGISDAMLAAALAAYRQHRTEHAGMSAALTAAGLVVPEGPYDTPVLDAAVRAYRKGQEGQKAAMTRALTAVAGMIGADASRRGPLHQLIRQAEAVAREIRLLSGGRLTLDVVQILGVRAGDRQGMGWHEAHQAADIAIDTTDLED